MKELDYFVNDEKAEERRYSTVKGLSTRDGCSKAYLRVN